MIYVTMFDKFLSGWGRAEGKRNKLAFECENYTEAYRLMEYAKTRSEMQYINITQTKPKQTKNQLLQFFTKETASAFYK